MTHNQKLESSVWHFLPQILVSLTWVPQFSPVSLPHLANVPETKIHMSWIFVQESKRKAKATTSSSSEVCNMVCRKERARRSSFLTGHFSPGKPPSLNYLMYLCFEEQHLLGRDAPTPSNSRSLPTLCSISEGGGPLSWGCSTPGHFFP